MPHDSQPPLEITQEERLLFAERIARSLDARPLTLAPEAHRQAIASLIGRLGTASFYELLSVPPGASQVEIHDAYERLARMVHPRHAGILGIAGRQGVLDLLLERATRAYLTLSHPGRRKDYDRELGSRPWSAETWGAERDEEERNVARRYFAKADLLAAQEEYHLAIELLRQAVRIDPKAEYHALLGKLEAKNPHWLRHAAGNLERAIELGARDPALPAALARVREMLETGQVETAGPAGGAPAAPARSEPKRARRKLPFRRR